MRDRLSSILCIAAAALLCGCTTAGKDYAGPPAPPHAAGFARAGADVQPAQPTRLAEWWTTLGDPELDRLVQRALAANPNLGIARARVRQARAGLRGERANGLPNGTATLMAAHARLPTMSGLGGGNGNDSSGGDKGGSGSQLPSSLNLYNLGFDASWEIDLFGGHRRAVEAASANADAADASLADTQLSLAADVAAAYVNLRSSQQRLRLSNEAIAREQQVVDLTAARVRGGTASQLDLVRLQGQLEATRAQSDPLQAQVDTYRDALAVLAGAAPGALDAELANEAPVPLPPAQVAVGDPDALLRRRPDIRAAERQLAARTAQIGAAQAARFPHLTLLGLIGVGGTRPSDLTHLDDFAAIAAPRLSWNVLDFGRSGARIEQAQGARDEAEAQYRAAVLDALRDAEDALARFRQARVTIATAARANAAADRAAFLTRARQQGGTASLIDVLDVERQQIAAGQSLAEAQAALTASFIALEKALGLGWQERADSPVR